MKHKMRAWQDSIEPDFSLAGVSIPLLCVITSPWLWRCYKTPTPSQCHWDKQGPRALEACFALLIMLLIHISHDITPATEIIRKPRTIRVFQVITWKWTDGGAVN